MLLDKFSVVRNHPLVVSKTIFESFDRETHLNDLIKKVMRRRKTEGNIIDEARIIKSIGFLISLGKVGYYKGFVYKS